MVEEGLLSKYTRLVLTNAIYLRGSWVNEFDSGYEVKNTLIKMGMPIAFSDNSDFSGMNATKGKHLKISNVVHKAFVDVDEEGTEAVAVTADFMFVVSEIEPENKPKIFQADHPFIFLIRDMDNDNILFMGRANNPKSQLICHYCAILVICLVCQIILLI